MFFNGLHSIAGAGWGKTTALGEKWRNDIAVAFDHAQTDLLYKQSYFPTEIKKKRIWLILLHSNHPFRDKPGFRFQSDIFSFATKDEISAGDFREKSGRTAKTMSAHSGYSNRCKRNDSRIIRFILFRFTAPFSLRWTLIPILLNPSSLGQKIREKPLPHQRVPCLYTLSNSRPFLSRDVFGSLYWGNAN